MTTRADLKSFLDDLKIRFLKDPANTPVESAISEKIDNVILEFWGDREAPGSFALFAIGGYGRGAVHPQSDIDLLFFFTDGIDEEAIKRVQAGALSPAALAAHDYVFDIFPEGGKQIAPSKENAAD